MVQPIGKPGVPLSPYPPAGGIDVVYLTCFDAEFTTMALVLQYSGIRVRRADTLEKADFLLTVTGSTVLLTDFLFLDGDWRDALRMAAGLHPVVGCAVAVDPLDSHTIADLYDLGGCGALWKPVEFPRAAELIRTVDQAARDRMSLRPPA